MKKVTKRYEICSFPSYLGTPWQTNFRFVARLMMLFRTIVSRGEREIRIIDNETGEHIVW